MNICEASIREGTWQFVSRRGVRFHGRWIGREIIDEHYGKRVFVRNDGAVLDGDRKTVFIYSTSPDLSSTR